MDTTVHYMLCVINGVSPFIIVPINLLIIVSVIRKPSLHSPSNLLLIGLAASDFGVGSFVQPLLLAVQVSISEGTSSNAKLQQVFVVTTCSLCAVSFLTVTLISIDRFLALHLHLRYSELVNARRITCIQIAVWLASGFAGSSWLWSGVNLYYFLAIPTMIIGLLVTAVCYLKIFLVLKRHHSQINSQLQQVQMQQQENQLDLKRFQKSALTMFLIFVLLILCYFPYMVVVIYFEFLGRNKHFIMFFNLALTFVFLNSLLNPILYCARLSEIRAAVRESVDKVLHCCTN